MRAQAIAIFLTVVVALVGVSYYQVGAGVSSDAKALGEAAARSQIAALIPAFLSEFKIINEQFDIVAPRVLGQPTDFNDSISNRFEMVARLQLGANGVWSIQQRAFHDKTRVKSWAENYTQIALKGLKPRDIPLGGTALTALLDPQRRPFFLWIMRGNANGDWSAVITKTDVFQAIIDRQRGQNVSVILVNKQGQALGHTTADYVGTTLKDDPIVTEITRAGKAQGVGTFRTNAGVELQGLYEQVPGSNSYVVLARPLTALNERVSSLRLQILLFGGGFALLGVAVMMLALKSVPPRAGAATGLSTGGGYSPTAPASPMSPSSPAMPAPAAAVATPAADLAREKMKAYTTSASALAREMHGPLTRILSQAQLLKAKSVNEEEVTRIEELAREGRGIVLKLLSFAGEEEFRAEPTSVNEVLNRALGAFESKLQIKGIKLEKNLKRMPEVSAHPLALMKIVEALFNNAIEAMERMPKKELTVSLESEGTDVLLRIKDTGEGIAPDRAGQVFDPFFTTKNASQHSGLGLSTAFGLAREFGGDLLFSSVAGQGTTVTLKFPVGVAASAPIATAPSPVAPSSAAPSGLGAPSAGLGRSLPNLDDLPPAPSKPAAPPPMAPPAPSALSSFMKPESTPQPAAPPPARETSSPTLGELPELDLNFELGLSPSKAEAPSAPPPVAPKKAVEHAAPLSGIGANLPPNPTGRAPAAPATSAPLRSVPMPAGPGGQPPPAGTAVAQKPPTAAPLPPRQTGATPQAPLTVTPSVPLGVGLELSGELAGTPPEEAGSSSVIQERAINETLALIDQVENGPLTPIGGAPGDSPAPSAEVPSVSPENTGFGKIDKPTFAAKKPTAKVAGASVAIRKPGERK
ncbi:MAG: sensor histidine kinase [Bdellovibrionaceae bacterium]|nr:sensor histidine kinase [Pseudobdellovibrionaceae bacterium]